MNRHLWTRNITKSSCPMWQCPHCRKGVVTIKAKSLQFEETVESRRLHSDPEFDADWVKHAFTAWGKCSNSQCGQAFAIAGEGGVSPEYTSDEGDWEYEEYFVPKYCFPMPHIIDIPRRCPDEIKIQLTQAFSLFWSDRPACAGRIRVSLEGLMNYLGVPKKRKSRSGGFNELTLHARIDAYAEKYPQVGAQLMALKWLGNTGSHENEVSKIDILDAFEILEHALVEVLEKRTERVEELTKRLVKKHARK